MALALQKLKAAAAHEHPVLLLGETGVGKELAAEAIHEHSRPQRPWVIVDCAALPAELIESELFGHVQGAFSGAQTARVGAFEAAGTGTLFIDEVGELPMPLQAKLLRVIEKKQIKPLGSNEVRKIHCRILSATHRDLQAGMKTGAFRSDLYYRLAVDVVALPVLRERSEDILPLAHSFVEACTGKKIPIDERSEDQLENRAWPGNIRELRNVVEAACALSGEVISIFEPSPPIEEAVEEAPDSAYENITEPLWRGRGYKEAKQAVLADFERGWLTDLLERHQHNISAAAKAAGIHRNILHRMLRKYQGLG